MLSCCGLLEMNFTWGGAGRAGWGGGFTSATCVVAATCTSWATLLSHPCVDKSGNHKGQTSLSEGETGQLENGHGHSGIGKKKRKKKEGHTWKKSALNTEWLINTKSTQ